MNDRSIVIKYCKSILISEKSSIGLKTIYKSKVRSNVHIIVHEPFRRDSYPTFVLVIEIL